MKKKSKAKSAPVDEGIEEMSELEKEQADYEAAHADRVNVGAFIARRYTVDAGALLEMAKDKPDFLIPDLIPAASVMLMVGKPGSKKSWLAYSAVLAIVQQKPWFGATPEHKHSALVLNFDNPASELGRRFRRMGLQPEDNIRFHSIGLNLPPANLPPILQLPGCVEPLFALVCYMRPSIILIDSMRQSHTGDEASSEDMGLLMNYYRSLTHYGATVLVLHHTRKAPKEGDDDLLESSRGSSAIGGGIDAQMVVDDGTIRWGKTRLWQPQQTSYRFSVVDDDEHNTTYVDTGLSDAERVERVLRRQEEGIQRQELAKRTALPMEQLVIHLRRLEDAGKVESVRMRIEGKQVRVLKWKNEEK